MSGYPSTEEFARLARIANLPASEKVAALAAMESFFALLQKNVLDRRSWTTREQLRIAMVTWIELTYYQAALGRLTPVEFEAIMSTPAERAT